MRNQSLPKAGHRRRPVAVAVSAAVLMLTVAGCGEATRPTPLPEVIGNFDLAQIDGRALPQVVSFPGGAQCELTQARLRLTAGRKWDWFWSCVELTGGVPREKEWGAGDWFEQPTADSIVFPTNSRTVPAYWGAGRVRGDLLEIATLYPVSTDPLFPGVIILFDEHQWTFRRQ